MSDTNSSDVEILEYPRYYFNQNTGANPKTIEDAALLWRWRKNRPKGNSVETEPPNGLAMLNEINEMRAKLRAFTKVEYINFVRQRAREFGLWDNATNNNVVLTNDIKAVLTTLENAPANNRLFYDVFFAFHKDRKWLSSVVDKFFIQENMKLTPAEKIDDDKLYHESRGGFSIVARFAKCQTIQMFKNNLYNNMRWCIAPTKPSTQPTRTKPKIYTKIDIENDKFYYIVTPPEDENIMFFDEKVIANIDDFYDIDYDTIARKLNVNYVALKKAIQKNTFFKNALDDYDQDPNDMNLDDDNDNDTNIANEISITQIVTDVINEFEVQPLDGVPTTIVTQPTPLDTIPPTIDTTPPAAPAAAPAAPAPAPVTTVTPPQPQDTIPPTHEFTLTPVTTVTPPPPLHTIPPTPPVTTVTPPTPLDTITPPTDTTLPPPQELTPSVITATTTTLQTSSPSTNNNTLLLTQQTSITATANLLLQVKTSSSNRKQPTPTKKHNSDFIQNQARKNQSPPSTPITNKKYTTTKKIIRSPQTSLAPKLLSPRQSRSYKVTTRQKTPSPNKKKLKGKENNEKKPCDHENVHTYQCTDIATYFTTSYYEKHTTAPSFCTICGEEKLFGTAITVNAKNPVYVCVNNKLTGECKHALCNSCYNTLNEKTMEMVRKIEKESQNQSNHSNIDYIIYIMYALLY